MDSPRLFAPLLCCLAAVASAHTDDKTDIMKSPIKPDEAVTLFTTAAWPSQKLAGAWEVEIHGVIYEEERRRILSAALVKALDLQPENLTEMERDTLKQRTALFMVDNERDKALPVQVGTRVHLLAPSGPNGHFQEIITLSGDAVTAAAKGGLLPLQVLTPPGDTRSFTGSVCVLPDGPAPLVISDVDDTIKVSSVRDRQELKRHTFCRPFQPVAGMAELYQSWARNSAAGFCYVTSSPYQLYRPLEEFRQAHLFPPGAWQMKHLRLMDTQTIRALFAPQTEHKLEAIEPLLERWPLRPVILVGDSGEQDPEIFAALARRHPRRIARIFIRTESGELRDARRYREAFEGIDPAKWQLFRDAAELPQHL